MKVNAKHKQHREGKFLGTDEVELYYQSWYPDTVPRATIAIVHGLGAHSGIFNNLAEFLCDRNFAVYGLDLRGHGRSSGKRGYINSWNEFRQDLNAFLQLIKTKENNIPLFLLGQSLGGTIALDYALKDSSQLQGLILFSPALKVRVAPIKSLLGRIFSRFLPDFTLDTGIYLETISRDGKVVTAASCDPLRHTKVTARLATEFWQTVAGIEANARKLQIPVLILHGGGDRVTLPQTSLDLFKSITSSDKERYLYPGGYHELQNDFDCQNVFRDLENWIDRKTIKK